jgi:hypothetical protein
MAESNAPQPGHPLMTHLDQVFTGDGGNGPALVGWLEYLAHPEQNTGPRVLEMPDGTAFESSGKPHPNTTDHVGERSVLRDLAIDRFFAHADVLSGQQIGTLDADGEVSNAQTLGATFDLIEEVRLKREADLTVDEITADVWTEFTNHVSFAISRENWDGGAADNARGRYVQLRKWYENHRNPALAKMNTFLVQYAAILMKARTDVNELMGKAVAVLQKAVASDPIDGLAFAVSVLEKALDLTINFPKTALDAALKVTSEVKNALGALPKAKENTGFGIDTSDIQLGYYRFFESFIEAGDKVCWEAAGAVSRLITDRENGLLFVRRNWEPASSWPR